ncbi:hypothetical protein AAFF_G00247600 [Aldrovandia affinis]|uniref:Polyprotein n=1 Tax=Aldrovandia affinis TaxID=143900 RepID=A0AAD7WTR7_9TELE|nr:hypothetical protein AAFF_G00247600 [Aldrovandia affinis]
MPLPQMAVSSAGRVFTLHFNVLHFSSETESTTQSGQNPCGSFGGTPTILHNEHDSFPIPRSGQTPAAPGPDGGEAELKCMEPLGIITEVAEPTEWCAPMVPVVKRLSRDSIKTDAGKVEAIMDMPTPTNITRLRQMLGMVNYLRKFLPGDSSELHPVIELLKKDMEWLWEKPQKLPFNKSNGAVGRAAGTAKRIPQQLHPHLALMCYCTMLIAATGVSPDQLMTGCQIMTTVPVLEKRLKAQLISYKDYTQVSVRIKLDGEKGWNTPGTMVNPSGKS